MKSNKSKILIALFSVILVSCNPFMSKDVRRSKKCNKKLEKVVIKCPELLNKDTIIDTLIIELPKVEIDSFITLNYDTVRIDSIVNLIQNDTIKKVVKEFIYNENILKDTIIHKIDGYTFIFYSNGNNIHYKVEKPLEVLKIENKTIVDTIKPIKVSWFDKIASNLWVIIIIIIGVLVLLFIFK